jgi:hypothetical protein
MTEEKKESPFDVVDMPGHPGRYIIVDRESGKVLDNANGYGYKTKPNAYRAGWYKYSGGKSKVDATRAWWRKHRSFYEALSDEMFYIAKDCCGIDDGGKTYEEELRESAMRMAEDRGITDFKVEYLKHMDIHK